jgi:hypothetical protein
LTVFHGVVMLLLSYDTESLPDGETYRLFAHALSIIVIEITNIVMSTVILNLILALTMGFPPSAVRLFTVNEQLPCQLDIMVSISLISQQT